MAEAQPQKFEAYPGKNQIKLKNMDLYCQSSVCWPGIAAAWCCCRPCWCRTNRAAATCSCTLRHPTSQSCSTPSSCSARRRLQMRNSTFRLAMECFRDNRYWPTLAGCDRHKAAKSGRSCSGLADVHLRLEGIYKPGAIYAAAAGGRPLAAAVHS